MLRSILILLSLVFVFSLANAEIFKWVDSEGNVHFTDKPPKNTKTKKVTVKINSYQSVQVIKPKESNIPKSHAAKPAKSEFVNKKVIMYSAEWCGVCRKAKRYFKKNQIAFTELDIDKNQQAKQEYKALNAHGVPVIFIDDTRLNGFSKQHFESIYYR